MISCKVVFERLAGGRLAVEGSGLGRIRAIIESVASYATKTLKTKTEHSSAGGQVEGDLPRLDARHAIRQKVARDRNRGSQRGTKREREHGRKKRQTRQNKAR
ncbi:hypothetical protein KM043_002296 [Ampulex compressa]|nr:hypothetical protein KM043_002296 [Ampulex compressa]